jgi:hypothetical protein
MMNRRSSAACASQPRTSPIGGCGTFTITITITITIATEIADAGAERKRPPDRDP